MTQHRSDLTLYTKFFYSCQPGSIVTRQTDRVGFNVPLDTLQVILETILQPIVWLGQKHDLPNQSFGGY